MPACGRDHLGSSTEAYAMAQTRQRLHGYSAIHSHFQHLNGPKRREFRGQQIRAELQPIAQHDCSLRLRCEQVAPYLHEMLSSPFARRFEDLAWHTSTPWLIRRCTRCRLSIVKSKSAAWFSLRPFATPRRCSSYCSF